MLKTYTQEIKHTGEKILEIMYDLVIAHYTSGTARGRLYPL